MLRGILGAGNDVPRPLYANLLSGGDCARLLRSIVPAPVGDTSGFLGDIPVRL